MLNKRNTRSESTNGIYIYFHIGLYYNLYFSLFNSLLLSSTDNLGKQFGPRSGTAECSEWSEPVYMYL